MSFPFSPQVTEQVKKLLSAFDDKTYSRDELMKKLAINHREYFRSEYLQPAIRLELVALTIPEKPRSRNQRYFLTEKARKYK